MLVVWEQTNAYYLLLYFKRKTFGSKRGQRYRFESCKEHHLPEWWNGRRGCLKSSYPFGCVGSSPTLGTIRRIRKIKNVARQATEPVRWPPIDRGVGGSRQMRISCDLLNQWRRLYIGTEMPNNQRECSP